MIKALYIHIPFCCQKCNYCDFVSFSEGEKEYDRYAEILIKELKFKKEEYNLDVLDTIFIGGGTPTVLSLSSLEKILLHIKENFNFSPLYEFTIEGNPESINKEKLLLMRKYGVNRISMGVQSFNEEILKFLGRSHNRDHVFEAFKKTREAGFTNISMDLIYGIPNESFESWQETLTTAVNLSPEHISAYQLKIEEGTPLYQRLMDNEIQIFPDDLGEKIYLWNLSYLKEKQLINYEISNFAKEGFSSKHNLNYWNYLPYAAAGFGGIGSYGNYRSEFEGSFKEYLSTEVFTKDVFQKEVLTEKEQITEYIIMNLRKSEGFLLQDFFDKFNVSFLEIYGKQVEKILKNNHMKFNDNRVFLTLKGRLLGNHVLEEFV